MNWDTVTDIARIIDVILSVVVLYLLHKAFDQKGHRWTPKMVRLYRFLAVIMVAMFLGSLEKIATNSPPAVLPFVLVGVYIYGIRAISEKGGYEK
jgi:hypothetical protein